MASISTDSAGRRRILFFDADGKRKVVRLGKMPKKDADTIKTKIEALNRASLSQTAVDDETSKWLAGISDKLHNRLETLGLAPKRVRVKPERAELALFLDSYIKSRSDVKKDTAIVYGHTRRCLVSYFGARKKLDEITPGEADEWRRHLAQSAEEGGEGLADNTVRRRCAIAKQFFRAAVRKRLIKENPFGDMKGISVRGNKEREFFVTREMADLILDACPDVDWRVIFVLSRYGGLRCPSEHLGLRWRDIDWARNRMTVTSPKTAHHDGKETREVPLFPELRRELEIAFERAADGAEFVITRYRDAAQNLRTTFEKIIRRAGLEPWPKLFQNLRATRETELAETYPIHVVCEWIGNSQAVAAKHYLQVTDDHFADAAGVEKEAQKAARSAAVSAGRDRTRVDREKVTLAKDPIFPEENEVGPFQAIPVIWVKWVDWAAQDSNL